MGNDCRVRMHLRMRRSNKGECRNLVNLLNTILSADWGMIVFKPPRASSLTLYPLLEKELIRLLKLHSLYLIGKLYVRNLTENHVKAMYPGDTVMPYWKSLENKMIEKPAIYYLFRSSDNRNISAKEIDMIKGWYCVDKKRQHYTRETGLRAIYYHEVVKTEGSFPFPMSDSDYEDTGIHAPCSLLSRYLQLFSFMTADADGANQIRSCLFEVNKNPAR